MYLSEYADQDATGLARLIHTHAVSVDEVRAVALQAILTVNPQINALVEAWDDEPVAAQGPFHGVPLLLKDLGVSAAGRRNELGSALAQGCTADADSELMTRLRRAGLMPLGRTTTPNSPPAPPPKAAFQAPPATRGTCSAAPVVPAAARQRRWRRGWYRWRMRPMAAAQSAYPRPCAACSGSSRAVVACPWGRTSTKSGVVWQCTGY